MNNVSICHFIEYNRMGPEHKILTPYSLLPFGTLTQFGSLEVPGTLLINGSFGGAELKISVPPITSF